jgi:hypothetical protein
MKRNIWLFGLLLGTILCANMFYMVHLCYTQPEMDSNAVIGYTIQIVIFSMIFFGTRNYRNKVLDGIVSFGRAFKTGLFIALVGSTVYVVVWLFYYYLFVPDFIDQYTLHVLREAAKEGPAELAEKTTYMADFKENYKNPLFIVMATYFEVLPVGIVVALVSALVLKRKEKTEVIA